MYIIGTKTDVEKRCMRQSEKKHWITINGVHGSWVHTPMHWPRCSKSQTRRSVRTTTATSRISQCSYRRLPTGSTYFSLRARASAVYSCFVCVATGHWGTRLKVRGAHNTLHSWLLTRRHAALPSATVATQRNRISNKNKELRTERKQWKDGTTAATAAE